MRAAPLLLALALLPGCSAWSPVTLPTPDDPAWAIRHRMRVTDSTGRTTVGRLAVVRDSSLVVTRLDSTDLALPLGRIRLLEREHMSTITKVWLIGSAAVLLHGLFSRPERSGGRSPPGPCELFCFDFDLDL